MLYTYIYVCVYVKSPPHTIRILFLVQLAVDPINVNSPFDPSRVRNEPCAFERKTTLKPKPPAKPYALYTFYLVTTYIQYNSTQFLRLYYIILYSNMHNE